MNHSAMLDELERDVERARARLAEDIARLRSPAAMSHARADLAARANDYKDQIMERVSDAVSERAQGLTKALRRQAQDNPAAVAVIGAGVVWRLWRKPPVTTLLLGAGLASLLAGRGEARGNGGLIESVRSMNRATHAFTDKAMDVADDLAHQARDFSEQAAVAFNETADRAAIALSEINEHQRESLRESLRENPMALSFAAMALGAAIALALNRRG
jgi:hypothetical protein